MRKQQNPSKQMMESLITLSNTIKTLSFVAENYAEVALLRAYEKLLSIKEHERLSQDVQRYQTIWIKLF